MNPIYGDQNYKLNMYKNNKDTMIYHMILIKHLVYASETKSSNDLQTQ